MQLVSLMNGILKPNLPYMVLYQFERVINEMFFMSDSALLVINAWTKDRYSHKLLLNTLYPKNSMLSALKH